MIFLKEKAIQGVCDVWVRRLVEVKDCVFQDDTWSSCYKVDPLMSSKPSVYDSEAVGVSAMTVD